MSSFACSPPNLTNRQSLSSNFFPLMNLGCHRRQITHYRGLSCDARRGRGAAERAEELTKHRKMRRLGRAFWLLAAAIVCVSVKAIRQMLLRGQQISLVS